MTAVHKPEDLEDKAYDEQYDEIANKYGAKAAGHANYGWGVDGDDRYTSIATKVYLRSGHQVLNTVIDHETGEISHEWTDY